MNKRFMNVLFLGLKCNIFEWWWNMYGFYGLDFKDKEDMGCFNLFIVLKYKCSIIDFI